MSLIEAIANVVIGYGIAVITQIIVFPVFGFQLGTGDNLAIGAIFTLVSLVRSFALRRLFEARRRPHLNALFAAAETSSADTHAP